MKDNETINHARKEYSVRLEWAGVERYYTIWAEGGPLGPAKAIESALEQAYTDTKATIETPEDGHVRRLKKLLEQHKNHLQVWLDYERDYPSSNDHTEEEHTARKVSLEKIEELRSFISEIEEQILNPPNFLYQVDPD